MFHVVLYQPEIPPNTGNIIRLCANSGANLHLIHPLGFEINDKRVRRAGLDYHEWASVQEYHSIDEFVQKNNPNRIFACTTKAKQTYSNVNYQKDDVFLFGPETRGLPHDVLETFPEQQKIRIPMQRKSRSLNLANAVSIILFEAWRQIDFRGSSLLEKPL